jgi:phage terminase small subunit
MAEKEGLSERQELFCREYVIDMNGTQAAIRAGYAKGSAEVQASRLLSNDKIAMRVKELKSEVFNKLEISAEYVLSGLKELAERCMQRIPVREWDHEAGGFIQKTDDQGNTVWEFDSKGAVKAFELLGKHTGIFEKDNNQKGDKIKITVKKSK